MEKVKNAYEQFSRALATLDEILKQPFTVIVRDASIQRFEYTFETFWKLLKISLLEFEGFECASPKSCMRKALETGLIKATEIEDALLMCDDRNLVSHTYIENIAATIYQRLAGYAGLMKNVKDRVFKNPS